MLTLMLGSEWYQYKLMWAFQASTLASTLTLSVNMA